MRPDRVAVAAAAARARDVAGGVELVHDPVGGSLGDADHLPDFAQANTWVLSDAEQHLGVVREKRPAGSAALWHYSRLAFLDSNVMYLIVARGKRLRCPTTNAKPAGRTQSDGSGQRLKLRRREGPQLGQARTRDPHRKAAGRAGAARAAARRGALPPRAPRALPRTPVRRARHQPGQAQGASARLQRCRRPPSPSGGRRFVTESEPEVTPREGRQREREARRTERPQGMVPGRDRRRTKVERGSMRLLATGGIIGLDVALGAVLVGQD